MFGYFLNYNFIRTVETYVNSRKHVNTLMSTLSAQATTGGGRAFENKYGRDFCLSKLISSALPVV